MESKRFEDAIAPFIVSQHGVVSYSQLQGAGVSAAAIQRRARDGRLRRLHRGVYLCGPVMPPRAREAAAVLACGGTLGPGDRRGVGRDASTAAVVSHRSAAALWKLGQRPLDDAPVQITSSARSPHRRSGIRVHRVGTLHSDDVTMLDGVPLTAPARTLCDIARALTTTEFERAVAQALARRIVTQRELRATLARCAHRPGVSRLRSLLRHGQEPALTRSAAEAGFLDLLRRAGLTPPEVNARVAGFEVDFLWRKERFIVEVDGFAFHSARAAFENDRRREVALATAGMQVVRVTWRQIVREPEALVVMLARALPR